MDFVAVILRLLDGRLCSPYGQETTVRCTQGQPSVVRNRVLGYDDLLLGHLGRYCYHCHLHGTFEEYRKGEGIEFLYGTSSEEEKA